MEKSEIQSLIESLGLAYNAVFVPFSQSRNAGEKHPSLNWKITISKSRHQQLTTDYMQGIGHLQGYNFAQSRALWYTNSVKHAAESGKWNSKLTYETQYSGFPNGNWKPIPSPQLIDVLHSIILDSEVLDCSSFEEWADMYGYDIDSRKAEKTYRDCLEIALKIRIMLGDNVLTQLREAYQDY